MKDKVKFLNTKTVLAIIFLIACLEAIYIWRYSSPAKNIILPSYSYYDSRENKDDGSDSLVSAEGSWISETEFAYPIFTTSIDCWKDFDHCWVASAYLDDKYNVLSSDLDLHQINYWNDDFIETKPSDPGLGCVEEFYRVDRRSKTVSYTRKTINNTGSCEGIQKEPITSHLGDGQARLDTFNKLHGN